MLRARTLTALIVFTALSCVVALPAAAQAPSVPQAGCPPVASPPAPPPSPSSPTTSTDVYHPAPEALLACVGGTPITGALFSHWFTVAERGVSHAERAHPVKLLQEVMGFLISSDWVLGEAQELHITVTDTQVRHTFDSIRHQQFRHEHEFRKFLKSSGQTVEDLLLRVRLNMLSSRIQRYVAKHGHSLSHFVVQFRRRWSGRTYCQKAYFVADCGRELA
jgi:hypothetical protein